MKSNHKPRKSIFTKLLNGFVVGNADNDPAGISTYTIAGARTGLSLSLFHILSTPLMINTQAICARIGDVTKKGLASVIRLYYGPKIALFLMLLVITANIATLGANFAGLAAGLQLLLPQINLIYFLPLITLAFWLLMVFNGYHLISRVFAGMGIIFISYIITAFLAQPDWSDVLRQIFLPQIQFTPQFWLTAVAVLGTTITPFLFYWQVTEEIEDHPSVKDVKSEIGQVSLGLIWCNVISTFIIITSALTLNQHGVMVNSAAQAALALEPLAGKLSSVLFAVGFIGSGLLAIPLLASTTAYTIAETFNWRRGLNKKLNQAGAFYTLLAASLVVGAVIAYLNINPIEMIFYTQVLNGLITPIILTVILALASKEIIMKSYVISGWQKTIGWLTVLIMTLSITAAIISGFN